MLIPSMVRSSSLCLQRLACNRQSLSKPFAQALQWRHERRDSGPCRRRVPERGGGGGPQRLCGADRRWVPRMSALPSPRGHGRGDEAFARLREDRHDANTSRPCGDRDRACRPPPPARILRNNARAKPRKMALRRTCGQPQRAEKRTLFGRGLCAQTPDPGVREGVEALARSGTRGTRDDGRGCRLSLSRRGTRAPAYACACRPPR
jgi:hypothetical protein